MMDERGELLLQLQEDAQTLRRGVLHGAAIYFYVRLRGLHQHGYVFLELVGVGGVHATFQGYRVLVSFLIDSDFHNMK